MINICYIEQAMSKKGWGLILLAIGLIGLLVFIFYQDSAKGKATIQLNSYPKAKVYINNQEAGTTPYQNDTLQGGEVLFRLVPEATFSASWERKLVLTPKTETIVNWKFDPNPEQEAGEIIYLEKTSLKNKAGLTVTCQPDACSVSVDGQMRGFAPLALEDIGAGSHRIILALPGYKTREVLARAINHYRLVVEVKLAKESTSGASIVETKDEEELGKEETERPYILIKETPTGWLRVRMGSSTAATEAAKVNPGEKYPLLDEKSGWYKIRYQRDKEGWVSGRYAEKFE